MVLKLSKKPIKTKMICFYIHISSDNNNLYWLFMVFNKVPALPTGDTNKATYMIQLFHMISLLSVAYLNKYKKSTKYPFVIFLLIAVYIHNYSAGLTGFL